MLSAGLRKWGIASFNPSARLTPRLYGTKMDSIVTPYAVSFVQRAFRNLPRRTDSVSRMNLELKETILLNHYKDAVANNLQSNELMTAIPGEWSLTKKISHLRALREKYYAMPVLTGHPTEILSEPMRQLIDRIVRQLLELGHYQRGTPEALALEQHITAGIIEVSQQSMLPAENLTPEEEILRQDHIYLSMMELWSDFKTRDAHQFVAEHGGELYDVVRALEDANKRSFQNVKSWGADRDGNEKKSAKTLALFTPGLQTAIIDLIRKRIEPLLTDIPKLQGAYDYLQRGKESIRDGIYFDAKGAQKAQKRLLTLLDTLIVTHAFDLNVYQQLVSLRDLVDIVGFTGHLKQFVRQTSKVNGTIFQEATVILSQHHPEIKAFMQGNAAQIRDYRDLEWTEKSTLHQYLRKDSKYFATLKSHADEFSAESIAELDVLAFVSKHRDMFSYILSDTEHSISLDEVVILFGFTAYRAGELPIDGVREAPVNLLPLFESPKDLARSEETLDAILSDPYLKSLIIELKELSYVAGPSDLGKEGGMFAHINLIISEIKAQNVLKKHQALDPRLADVQLRVLNGLGDDLSRRISESWAQLYATFQGVAGSKLGAVAGAVAYVTHVAGRPSENTCRAGEFESIEKNHPMEFALLQTLVEQMVAGYQTYNQHPASQALFKVLAISRLGPWLNTSSRGESKSATPSDITKSRAIGLVNYEITTFVFARIFMSANALCELPLEMQGHLPLLFEQSTTVREIVLKIIYSISISDFPRAWSNINPNGMPSREQIELWAAEFDDPTRVEKELHHTLAYLERQSHAILRAMTLFLPSVHQPQAHAYFDANAPLSRPSHELAIELLSCLGETDTQFKRLAEEIKYDLLPRYRRLARCLDEYQSSSEPTSMMTENAVLALRGDRRVAAGPQTISKMRVPLSQVLSFHEEQALTPNVPRGW